MTINAIWHLLENGNRRIIKSQGFIIAERGQTRAEI
jgi:hypothetical protein